MSQVTTMTPNVPDWVRRIMQQQADRTQMGNDAYQALLDRINEGNLVAPMNADQLQGLDWARGVANSPALANIIGMYGDTAQGKYLDQFQPGIDRLKNLMSGNPDMSRYRTVAKELGLNTTSQQFQDAFQAASRRLQPGIHSAFAMGGRTGSGLADVAHTQAQADAFAGLYDSNQRNKIGIYDSVMNRQSQAATAVAQMWGNERDRMGQAQTQYGQMALQPSQILSGVGDALQRQAQRELSAPFEALQGYASMVGGSAMPANLSPFIGSTTVSPDPIFPPQQQPALLQYLGAMGISPTSPEGKKLLGGAFGQGGGPKGMGSTGSALTSGLGGAGIGFSMGGPWGAAAGFGLGVLGSRL